MALIPVPKVPGQFYDSSTGQKIDIVDYRDGDRYDTVVINSGAISAGTEFVFFRDIGSKNSIDFNLGAARRLASGEEMLVQRIGVDVPMCFGNTIVAPSDIKRVAYGGYLLLKLNQKEVASGPCYTFPSGYGLAGQTTENNTGVVTVGVPSTAAKKGLVKEYWLTSDQDIAASIFYYDRLWDTTTNMATLGSRVHVRVFLGGLIRLRN